LEKARKRIKNSKSLLITANKAVPSDILPEWLEVQTAYEWLIKQQKHPVGRP